MQTNKTSITLNEGSFSTTTETLSFINDFWNTLSQEDQDQFIEKAFDELKGDGAKEVWEILKNYVDDKGLTEDDKDALARKLKIDRKLLNAADTVFTAMEVIMEASPIAIGIIWDALQLGPIDEAIGAVPVIGPVLAIITAILSYLPDGTIVGMLLSIGIDIELNIIKWLKSIIIHNVIPDQKDIDTFEAALTKNGKLTENLHSFAADFKLYESLWN